jgi:hypothetical protein
MSYERGWKAIHLEKTDKIPQTQYISHDEFTLKRTGVDTCLAAERPKAWPALARALDYDFIWSTYEMPVVQGRLTDMGHAEWSETDGVRKSASCPFESPEDVLDFDPVREYGIPDTDTMAKTFQAHLDEAKRLYPNAVFPGGRYNTIFSACIRTFGWDMFLGSATLDEERFDRVLEGFLEITLAEMRAWLKTDMKVYLTHDDIVWTSGPVFHPDWYRKYIFPRYKRIWAPLKEAGIPVMFCADGSFDAFVDDVAAAGADGFIFEPTTSLEYIVKKYGKTKAIVGNVDCRVLQFGTKDEIRAEVKRCIDLGRDCPGYFMAVGNHIPNGIPLENVECYFEVFEEMRKR